jgi:hypothetical protein
VQVGGELVVQFGNQDTQMTSITRSYLVEKLAASGNARAKGLFSDLLGNSKVIAIVGPSASALFRVLA